MDHILCLERQYQKIAMDSSFNQNETVTLYMGHSVYVCCINIVFKNKFQNITTSTFWVFRPFNNIYLFISLFNATACLYHLYSYKKQYMWVIKHTFSYTHLILFTAHNLFYIIKQGIVFQIFHFCTVYLGSWFSPSSAPLYKRNTFWLNKYNDIDIQLQNLKKKNNNIINNSVSSIVSIAEYSRLLSCR